MQFSILYVEDDYYLRQQLKEAVQAYNKTAGAIYLDLDTAEGPDDLMRILQPKHDIILADVYFPNTSSNVKEDQLDAIIGAVRKWDISQGFERPTPIIAYTGVGKKALRDCLKRKPSLYDIWDKSSASPEYVTWRLEVLAVKLSRTRPDSLMQRLIRGMPCGASWHPEVLAMTKGYDAGWTESDQIVRAGNAIENIAHKLKTWNTPCQDVWDVMKQWEAWSHAVSSSARGHARHVINVFWLGYYLLHHDLLRKWFSSSWQSYLVNDPNNRLVAGDDPLEALSCCWYYAGLFHDSAGCMENFSCVNDKVGELVEKFDKLARPIPKNRNWPPRKLQITGDRVLAKLPKSVRSTLKSLWHKSVSARRPDHGIVAAAHFMDASIDDKQAFYCREAARAMAIHNVIGELEAKVVNVCGWEEEPIICLLLLCDQIQSWDRERNDRNVVDSVDLERSELKDLSIRMDGTTPLVSMIIDYIGPKHLDNAPDLFEKTRVKLEFVLKDKPNRALSRIKRPWPFKLHVDCRLNGRPLEAGLDFY